MSQNFMIQRLFTLCLLVLLSIALAGPVQAGGHKGQAVSKVSELPVRSGDWSDEEVAKGRAQLVAAIDAAWIRIVASGRDQEVLAKQPLNMPGAAKSYIVRLVDCLPQPEMAPWPEKPVGMFKDILETGVIRQLIQGVPETPANTSWYFSGVSQGYQDMIIEDISKHYGVELKVESVVLPPGRLPATSVLNAGKIDFISQLNALGGNTEGMRRRESRRFSCTITASSQFIHIPEESELVGEINSLNDLIARPDIRICAGPLTTQTARAFMPEHTIKTKFVNDLTACDKSVKGGKLDVIMNPLNDLSVGGIEGYKPVHTLIVAGTPLWVADEGITCKEDGNPRTENECFKDDPL
ncbi:MAG: transporter substrate-binding domain-containing protein [Gammaproteobacteria bacterium]|nr:transporter substrate-binding domain-containing protein [Gammaproteobacteria bacterium]